MRSAFCTIVFCRTRAGFALGGQGRRCEGLTAQTGKAEGDEILRAEGVRFHQIFIYWAHRLLIKGARSCVL